MELECPACGGYDCYFDGLQFVCDDCGHAWATIATAPPVKIRMMKVRQRTVCRTFFCLCSCNFHLEKLYLFQSR